MDERFRGLSLLYNIPDGHAQNFFDYLSEQKVMIIGLGGVGSWTAESLVRSGIHNFILVDLDEICVSNLNRQIHTTESTIGKMKTEGLHKRLKEINPRIEVIKIEDFYTMSSSETIFATKPDWVVDAIDSLSPKCHLISECKRRKINLVVTGGAGGKKDPNQIRIDDLNHSINDGLLARVRKKLRTKYNFPGNKDPFGIMSIYSKEKVWLTENLINKEGKENKRIVNCHNGLGTASFITGQFGLMAASVIMNEMADSFIRTRNLSQK